MYFIEILHVITDASKNPVVLSKPVDSSDL